MPLNLSRGDRKLLLGAGAIFLVIFVAGILLSRRQDGTQVPTTYSIASEGAKAAYLFLEEAGYDVARWQRSPVELPGDATLILAEPGGIPKEAERAGLERFVSNGGHLIIAGPLASVYVNLKGATPDPLSGNLWKKAQALTPSPITRAAPEITLTPSAVWKGDSLAVPLYGEPNKPVVVKLAYGKGEVIWWASATPLTNAGLKEPGNLEFFLACLDSMGKRRILFDEYYHGYLDTPTSRVNVSVRWLALQAAVIAVAVILTFARRSGPIWVPSSEIRLSPLEFVQTLGRVYERADAASVAVDITYLRFRYRLARRLGMGANSSIEDVERVVRERWGFVEEGFGATLRSADAARRSSKLEPKEALHLVRALAEAAAKLKLFRPQVKEKD